MIYRFDFLNRNRRRRRKLSLWAKWDFSFPLRTFSRFVCFSLTPFVSVCISSKSNVQYFIVFLFQHRLVILGALYPLSLPLVCSGSPSVGLCGCLFSTLTRLFIRFTYSWVIQSFLNSRRISSIVIRSVWRVAWVRWTQESICILSSFAPCHGVSFSLQHPFRGLFYSIHCFWLLFLSYFCYSFRLFCFNFEFVILSFFTSCRPCRRTMTTTTKRGFYVDFVSSDLLTFKLLLCLRIHLLVTKIKCKYLISSANLTLCYVTLRYYEK